MRKVLGLVPKKRSTSALALKSNLYRNRIMKSKKIYSRKKKDIVND